MSVIGQQIKKFRVAKGVTQEQLGQLVGVSTQAVSKWECGGTPDPELLPSLSDALDVSIDALFGREEKSAAIALAQKLCGMQDKESFCHAFDLCWAMVLGLLHDPVPDNILNAHMDFAAMDSVAHLSFSRIMHDGGMVAVRNAPDFRHFFLMLEPEKGLSAHLSEPEKLRRVFSVLSDETTLRVLSSMYTRINTPVAASLISKISGVSIEMVEKQLEILCRYKLVKRTVIATAAGEMYSYMFNQESAVIALLCFADELARQEEGEFAWSITRTKPLLQTTIV
jgi:DNA-binding XRE family transcriptional regulator/DNA-binding HxlR family transcriptional regulator